MMWLSCGSFVVVCDDGDKYSEVECNRWCKVGKIVYRSALLLSKLPGEYRSYTTYGLFYLVHHRKASSSFKASLVPT